MRDKFLYALAAATAFFLFFTAPGAQARIDCMGNVIAGVASVITDTSTAALTAFDQAAPNGYFSTIRKPTANSQSVVASVFAETIWDSDFAGAGTGHQIGILGRADSYGDGDGLWFLPVEGRCDTTGNGVEDAVAMTQCTAFAATFGADTGSAANIGIGVGYYLGNMTDDGNVGTKLSFFSDDADWAFRNDGAGQFGGALTLASGQEAAGAGSQAAARYIGPMGSNDIGALGAGGVPMTAGQMYCTKIMMPKAGTMDSIQVEVLTDGGGDLRLGVYNDVNGLPGTVIEDGGALLVSSTGVKTDTLSTAVQAGVVWGCVAVQGSGLTIDFNIVMNYHEIYGVDASRTAGQAAALMTGVTGALPAFTGAIAGTSTLTPGIGISMQ